MPEIKPDLSDRTRCISVHWSLPVQCVLPCTHVENWHEAWHPSTGNRIRYRRSMGVYRTEELHDGGWHAMEIPSPGEICGEPHSSKPGVFCQWPRTHNERSWTHRALFEGCTYTWNTARREPTPEQVVQDLSRVRELAAEQAAAGERVRETLRIWRDERELEPQTARFLYEVGAALDGGESQ